MKFYVTTPEIAKGCSAIKAKQLGCSGGTAFWWMVIDHPTENLSAIVFTDEEVALAGEVLDENGNVLYPAETVKVLYRNPPDEPIMVITTDDLIDKATMIANGWFPDLNQI